MPCYASRERNTASGILSGEPAGGPWVASETSVRIPRTRTRRPPPFYHHGYGRNQVSSRAASPGRARKDAPGGSVGVVVALPPTPHSFLPFPGGEQFRARRRVAR